MTRRGLDLQYRDGYIFAYGRDYKAGTGRFRALSGAAPMLPRQAFGNWFSRYAPYPDSDYRTTLLPRTIERPARRWTSLVVDTDFKSPTRGTGGTGIGSSSETRPDSSTGRIARTWRSH